MLNVAIVGASGGIGAAMLEQLAARDDVSVIHATYHQSLAGGASGSVESFGGQTQVRWSKVDARDDEQVKLWLESVGKADWLINCVGMLHTHTHGPEKAITTFNAEHFNDSITTNTLPTLLLGKYAKNVLRGSSQGVFATMSARVGSISDNRLGGWYSYRASKAALNMVLKCLSIEWARSCKNIRVAALHPGTTDTPLSQPFQKNVPEGKLFSAEKTAKLLLQQIDELQHRETGCFIDYNGDSINW